MRGKKLLTLLGIIGLSLTLVMIPFMGACAPKEEEVVELKAIAAWPLHVGQDYWYHEFIKVVNERAEQQGVPLIVEKTGGPEVVGTKEQFAAMRDGVVDIVYTAGDYFTGETVELSAISCIRADPPYFLNALRETKVMDVVNEACREKSGVIALATTLMGRGFTLLSTKPINPGDWSGLKVRSIGGLTAVGIPAMGGSAMLVPPAEVFEGLQRGTFDAVIGAASDRYSFGERGVYKEILRPRFFFSATYFFISAKAWDGLPDGTKTFLKGVVEDLETEAYPWCRNWDDEITQKYIDEEGVKLVQCSPEEESKVAKAFRGDYLDFLVKESPEYGPRLYELIKDYVY